MAATNVQAFPGDVTISSNLAVGTVTATNLIRGVAEEAVRWNSQNETVFPQSATTQYHKIATLATTGNGSNGGKIRISGTIGGFGTSNITLIDAFVGTRGSVSYGGTLNGYGGDPTGVVDIVVYLESNGTFGVWLKLLRYFTFDFTLLGAQVSNNSRELAVLPCPTTNTSVAAPTGTLQGSVVSACSIVFTGDGNVGIGTTSPHTGLELTDNLTFTNTRRELRFNNYYDGGWKYINDGYAGNFRFENTGDFIFYTSVENTSGSDAAHPGLVAKMTIKNAGNVGIGTDDPGAPFEVHGPDLTGEAAGTTSLISRHVSGLDGVLNIFGVAAGNGEETLGLQTQIDNRAWATDIAGGWSTGNASRYDLLLQPYKGNVGIGTTTPNEKLEIYGDGIRIHDPDSSPKLDFVRGGTSRNPNTATFGLSDYADWRITANGARLNFQNQYTGGNSGNLLDVMTLEHGTGNVGIGETDPTCKLTVGDDSVSVNSSGGVLGIRQKGDTSSDGITLTSSHSNSTRIYKDGSGHFNIYNTGGGTLTLENVTGNAEISGYLKSANPAFYAYRTTPGNADGSYITYDASYANLGNHMNVSAGIFTCPVAGIYTFTWGSIGRNNNNIYRYYIRKNNSQIDDVHLRADNTATGTEYSTGERTVMVSLVATDTIRIHYQDSTGSDDDYGYNYTYFQGHLISYT